MKLGDMFPADVKSTLNSNPEYAYTGSSPEFPGGSVSDAGVVEISLLSASRANKVLAFDSSGNLEATQEIGTFKRNSKMGNPKILSIYSFFRIYSEPKITR